MTYYSCLKPSDIYPFKIATTKTSITIGWNEPNNNGCPITGFNILRDTGNNDNLSITVDPNIVSNRPSLRQYVIGLTQIGAIYRFKIRAYNNAGYSDSVKLLNVLLSDEPDAPT